MRRTLFFFLLLFFGSLWGYPPLPEPCSEEEALFARRIIGLWRDKESRLAQSELKNYLNIYPQSPLADHFWALLGDIELQGKSFAEALLCYEHIGNGEIKSVVLHKRWQALYHLGRYPQLYQECGTHLDDLEEEGRFYFAEAAFRIALTVCDCPEKEEDAIAFFEEALPYYELLRESGTFAHYAKLSLAEIYHRLNQPEKAAALYMELAQEGEDPEILYHAATLLLPCDREKAGAIFKKLAEQKSSRASDAAFQMMVLLAEQEQWERLAQERDLLTSCLEPDKVYFCYFYLGLLSFEKKMYDQAVSDLQKCVGHGLAEQHEKKALLTLLTSAGQTHDLKVCENTFTQLYGHFPDIRPQACCLLASAYCKCDQPHLAFKLYEEVARDFSESPLSEKAALEIVRLLIAQNKLKSAHEALLAFFNKYPESEKKGEMIRLAIEVSLKQEDYGQLAHDIHRAIEAAVFNVVEQRESEVLLAKAYLKLERVDAALQLMNKMEQPDPLVTALCYIHKGTPDQVVVWGEKALLHDPNESKLHLHLFNAYLELSKQGHSVEYTAKGAEHLYSVLDVFPISLENRLWLAHYYGKEDPARAIPILTPLVESEASRKKFDAEGLLLASLYVSFKRLDEAEQLLHKIVDLKQKTELEATLRLAEVYALKGKENEAKQLYQNLEEVAHLGIAYAARFHLACMNFSSDPESSLKKLKELIGRKTLVNEPLHLEAALEYAELKASLCSEQERPEELLKLLTEVKEQFTSQDDLSSKDYHASRGSFPEKDLIYQAYMRYLDARIYMVEALCTEDSEEKKLKQHAGRALFSTLRHGKYAVSNYLKEKSAVWVYEN